MQSILLHKEVTGRVPPGGAAGLQQGRERDGDADVFSHLTHVVYPHSEIELSLTLTLDAEVSHWRLNYCDSIPLPAACCPTVVDCSATVGTASFCLPAAGSSSAGGGH